MMTAQSEVIPLKKKVFEDARGAFVKFFDQELVNGIKFEMRQQNYVHTKSKGTLRGLHYQLGEAAEAKIFRVLSGAIQLTCIDVRPESPNRGMSQSLELREIGDAYLIPRGYATGYLTLADDTVVLYMSDNDYAPDQERGICPSDPAIKIDWLIPDYSTSEKDKNWPRWS